MSKIGRRPIALAGIQVDIKGQELHYKGTKHSGVHILPEILQVAVKDAQLFIQSKRKTRDTNRLWGLHRALLANCIQGASKGFERELEINGLGYKAIVQGKNINFSLGYSHKIDFALPDDVTAETDKTGQKLMLRSFDKALVGQVASSIKALRPPEPYKGTGIKYKGEAIRRKAGKTKS